MWKKNCKCFSWVFNKKVVCKLACFDFNLFVKLVIVKNSTCFPILYLFSTSLSFKHCSFLFAVVFYLLQHTVLVAVVVVVFSQNSLSTNYQNFFALVFFSLHAWIASWFPLLWLYSSTSHVCFQSSVFGSVFCSVLGSVFCSVQFCAVCSCLSHSRTLFFETRGHSTADTFSCLLLLLLLLLYDNFIHSLIHSFIRRQLITTEAP